MALNLASYLCFMLLNYTLDFLLNSIVAIVFIILFPLVKHSSVISLHLKALLLKLNLIAELSIFLENFV